MLCYGKALNLVLLKKKLSLFSVFRYTTQSNRFTLVQTCSHSDYCQLRVKVFSKCSIAFVASTDGLLSAYDFSSLNKSIRSTSLSIHQSGINDFDLSEIAETKLVRLATVGDDGSVHVCTFDQENWSWKREYSKEFTHQSPATGTNYVRLFQWI